METYVMQIIISIAAAVLVGAIGRLPYDTTRMSPSWMTAAMMTVVMVGSIYNSWYQYDTSRKLERLNRLLSGREEMRPELRGTVSRMVNIAREIE